MVHGNKVQSLLHNPRCDWTRLSPIAANPKGFVGTVEVLKKVYGHLNDILGVDMCLVLSIFKSL